MRTFVCSLVLLASLAVVGSPARGAPLECEAVRVGTISIDGLRNDWSDVTVEPLQRKAILKGASKWDGKPDLEGKLRCAHDGKGTYLMLEVNDDHVVRTRRGGKREDHVDLHFLTKNKRIKTLRIFPPNAKFRKGKVVWTSGRRSKKGLKYKVIRLRHGYAFELAIANGGVPGYGLGSPKLKMSLQIIDVDGGPGKPDTIMGTGGDTVATLGVIEYDTAKRLLAGFLKDKGLNKGNVLHYHVGNYITGVAREQLVIAGTFVTLIGEDVMKGGAYYAQPAPWAKKQSDLLRFRSIDLDGNGNLDIVYVVRQHGNAGFSRDILVVLRFLDTGKFDVYFMQEIAKRHNGNVMTNNYKFVKRGRKKVDIQISVGKNTGFTQQNYRNTGGGRLEALLTPWGGKKKKTYQFASDGYTEK